MTIHRFFKKKTIIHSRHFPPGVLVKAIKDKTGRKFVRIHFRNRKTPVGHISLTDVPIKDVLRIRRLPSRFKVWLFSLFGAVPKAKQYVINRDGTTKPL